jgi:hypothetical protein
MPTITIKPIDQIVKKWQTNAGAAGANYVYGVQNPRRPQAATAVAAAQSWATGVQQAVTNGSYAKGVAAGATKYMTNATGKGAQRYPTGITAGVGDFQNGIQPYLNILSNLQLPARLPTGDPGNIQRVSTVDAALRAAKLASK